LACPRSPFVGELPSQPQVGRVAVLTPATPVVRDQHETMGPRQRWERGAFPDLETHDLDAASVKSR
jgi:hypothetical protein